MILKMFSVLDMKAQFFGQPFFEQQEATAIRSFSDAVNDSSNSTNMWNRHPEDFQLYLVGSFDNETGEVVPEVPKALVMASSVHRAIATGDFPSGRPDNKKKREAPTVH